MTTMALWCFWPAVLPIAIVIGLLPASGTPGARLRLLLWAARCSAIVVVALLAWIIGPWPTRVCDFVWSVGPMRACIAIGVALASVTWRANRSGRRSIAPVLSKPDDVGYRADANAIAPPLAHAWWTKHRARRLVVPLRSSFARTFVGLTFAWLAVLGVVFPSSFERTLFPPSLCSTGSLLEELDEPPGVISFTEDRSTGIESLIAARGAGICRELRAQIDRDAKRSCQSTPMRMGGASLARLNDALSCGARRSRHFGWLPSEARGEGWSIDLVSGKFEGYCAGPSPPPRASEDTSAEVREAPR